MLGGEAIEAMAALAWEHRRAWHDEATVGVSLPFPHTLTDLVRTGDRVHLIEGCLSGTPDFLSDQLTQGMPLSKAVGFAPSRGFAGAGCRVQGPHPRPLPAVPAIVFPILYQARC